MSSSSNPSLSPHTPGPEPGPRPPHPRELVAAERRLHRRLRNRLNGAIEELGLSYAQLEIMLLLEDRPNMHSGQIALVLGSTRQAVHRLVGHLESADLVDVLPYDSGARPIALTALGRRRLRMAWRVIDETVHASLARMSGEERRTALDALEGCERALAPLRPRWWGLG